MPNLPSAAAFSQPGSVLGMMGAPPQQATLPTSQADQLHKVTSNIHLRPNFVWCKNHNVSKYLDSHKYVLIELTIPNLSLICKSKILKNREFVLPNNHFDLRSS